MEVQKIYENGVYKLNIPKIPKGLAWATTGTKSDNDTWKDVYTVYTYSFELPKTVEKTVELVNRFSLAIQGITKLHTHIVSSRAAFVHENRTFIVAVLINNELYDIKESWAFRDQVRKIFNKVK